MSHVDDLNAEPQPAPPRPHFVLVEDDRALAAACRVLATAERLAVDTEFVREKYYYPRLEMLQITGSNDGVVYLIDTQAIRQLGPLRDLMAGPALKIFHAADQDLEILLQELGAVPEPIFDTQVAAALLGFGAQASLVALVRAALGRTAVTGQSVSDWSARPFHDDQLAYAASDVEHLHDLHSHLAGALAARGRTPWFDEEQGIRVTSAKEGSLPDDELFWRVKDGGSLGGRDLAVLRELTIWREEEARRRNVPRRTVFQDEALVDVARLKPRTRQQAAKSRRINPGYYNRHQDEITAAMDRAMALPREQWPQRPMGERPDIPTGLMELCQALLRTEAEQQEIAPTVIARTADLQDLVIRRNAPDRDRNPLAHGWRHEIAGRKLIQLLSGQLIVRVGSDGQLMFEES